MFDKATRLKIRFETPRGSVSTEDLWDLPLTSQTGRINLNDIAIGLHKQLKASDDTPSFVEPAMPKNEELQLKFDIVKHVISVLVAERDAEKAKTEKALKKQQLLEVLARKENAALESKSADEIKEMINQL